MKSAFDLAASVPWAIQEEYLLTILEIADREADIEAVEARIGKPLQNTQTVTVREGVAVLPISGPIFRHANLFTRISGATSIDILARDFTQAFEDPTIAGIAMPIGSPGGTVEGTNEFAKMVRKASLANVKPIVAFASGNAASAAFWIASAAQHLFADDTAELGSIGVVMATTDTRQRDERSGVRRIEIVSSQSPDKRLDIDSEEGRAVLQQRVDAIADVFIEAVAEHRGVSAETVVRDFGRGGVLAGREAVAVGMADGISTLEDVLADLRDGRFGAADRRLISSGREKQTMTKMTAAEFAAQNPEGADALRKEGHAEGQKAGHAAGYADGVKAGTENGDKTGFDRGRAEGAQAERDRIANLEATALNGCEDLLKACIDDGKSTAADLALQQVAYLQKQGANAMDAQAKDETDMQAGKVPAPVQSESGGFETTGDASDDAAGDEDSAVTADKAAWSKDEKLRAEFAGNRDQYLAFRDAERKGRLKHWKDKRVA